MVGELGREARPGTRRLVFSLPGPADVQQRASVGPPECARPADRSGESSLGGLAESREVAGAGSWSRSCQVMSVDFP